MLSAINAKHAEILQEKACSLSGLMEKAATRKMQPCRPVLSHQLDHYPTTIAAARRRLESVLVAFRIKKPGQAGRGWVSGRAGHLIWLFNMRWRNFPSSRFK